MNDLNDNELVYLWRENDSQEALIILKNKYFEYLTRILAKYFHYKNVNNIIEIDDLLISFNKWFVDITFSYDYSQNKVKYIQYLIVQSKQLANNIFKKLKSKKNYVLNEYISYSNNDILQNKIVSDLKMYSPEEYFNFKEDYKFKINWIKKFLEKYDSITKEIFWGCFYGKDREILINKLNLTKTQFNNKFSYILKKMKDAYITFSIKNNC